MWKFENGMWTYVGINAGSSFGPLRTFDPNAYPGGRRNMICWKDNNGYIWMYGGEGYGSKYLADTWSFNGTYWAYWGGSTDFNVAPVYGSQKNFSFDNHPGGRSSSSVAITTDGSAAYIVGGYGYIPTYVRFADVWKFERDKGWAFWAGTVEQTNPNPGTKRVSSQSNKIGSLYDSMIVVDEFENVWIFGGSVVSLGMFSF